MLSPFIIIEYFSRPIKMAKYIVIKELIDNPLSVRPLHDKLKIVNRSSTYFTIT